MSQLRESIQGAVLEQPQEPINIGKYLGSGAQGEVFEVSIKQSTFALKWYFPKMASKQQRSAIRKLIEMGAPSDKYLWPIEMATTKNDFGFGYIMPLRENRFCSIADIYSRKASLNMWVLSTFCLNLVDAFSDLHLKGFAYKDIKSENVFFDPLTGDCCICDCDNITPDGQSHDGIIGTLGYSAPEIDRGEANPSIRTDLYSLAVLIFKVLFLHHPLEGIKETAIKILDTPARHRLYSYDPIFIFDPKNKSNRPDPLHHQTVLAHWPIYPHFLQKLFIQAFTVGLHDPDQRVRESIWRKALAKLRDAIVVCSCGAQNFFDFEIGKVPPKGICWYCQKPIPIPFHLQIGNDHNIILNSQTTLFPHHLENGKPFDFTSELAKVINHPTVPNLWGLKNLSRRNWIMNTPDRQQKEIPPGKSVALGNNIHIRFGGKDGMILCQSNN